MKALLQIIKIFTAMLKLERERKCKSYHTNAYCACTESVNTTGDFRTKNFGFSALVRALVEPFQPAMQNSPWLDVALVAPAGAAVDAPGLDRAVHPQRRTHWKASSVGETSAVAVVLGELEAREWAVPLGLGDEMMKQRVVLGETERTEKLLLFS